MDRPRNSSRIHQLDQVTILTLKVQIGLIYQHIYDIAKPSNLGNGSNFFLKHTLSKISYYIRSNCHTIILWYGCNSKNDLTLGRLLVLNLQQLVTVATGSLLFTLRVNTYTLSFDLVLNIPE